MKFVFCDFLEFAILEARDVAKGRGFGEKVGSVTSISNPTANEAVRRVAPVREVVLEAGGNKEIRVDCPEDWLYILNRLAEKYKNDIKGNIINRRYIKKEVVLSTCEELYIAKTTYYSLLNEVMFFALLLAVDRRLVKVD